MEERRMWTPIELAARMRVGVETIYRWIKSGKLQALRPAGGNYRIDDNEVKRILAPDGEGAADGD